MTELRKTIAQVTRRPVRLWPAVLITAGVTFSPFAMEVAGAQTGTTLTVAPTGTDAGNCQSAPCLTLGYALTQAGPSDEILVDPGFYVESNNANVVTPNLVGLSIIAGSPGNTAIDAAGNNNGLLIEASGVKVEGFMIENANLEGILAEPPVSSWPTTVTSPAANISSVEILDNVVTNNDKAYNPSLPPESACPSSTTDPDDCGEGIHLLGVSSSVVAANDVSHNVGGILLSDGGLLPSAISPQGGTSVGPAAHNLVVGNVSYDNLYDCGITLPGHDPRAVSVSGSTAGQPQPKLAGVYDNKVSRNVSIGNGGAGLLDAAPYPGTGSYNNTFVNNTATDNGNSGFTLHSHAPFQDVSGVRVSDNNFGPNNLLGDPDAGVDGTTGILLLSDAVPTTIYVSGNTVFDDTFGVAYNSNFTLTGHNTFSGVALDYAEYTPPAS